MRALAHAADKVHQRSHLCADADLGCRVPRAAAIAAKLRCPNRPGLGQTRSGRRELGALGLGGLRRGGTLVASRELVPLVLASAATLEVRCEEA